MKSIAHINVSAGSFVENINMCCWDCDGRFPISTCLRLNIFASNAEYDIRTILLTSLSMVHDTLCDASVHRQPTVASILKGGM